MRRILSLLSNFIIFLLGAGIFFWLKSLKDILGTLWGSAPLVEGQLIFLLCLAGGIGYVLYPSWKDKITPRVVTSFWLISLLFSSLSPFLFAVLLKFCPIFLTIPLILLLISFLPIFSLPFILSSPSVSALRSDVELADISQGVFFVSGILSGVISKILCFEPISGEPSILFWGITNGILSSFCIFRRERFENKREERYVNFDTEKKALVCFTLSFVLYLVGVHRLLNIWQTDAPLEILFICPIIISYFLSRYGRGFSPLMSINVVFPTLLAGFGSLFSLLFLNLELTLPRWEEQFKTILLCFIFFSSNVGFSSYFICHENTFGLMFITGGIGFLFGSLFLLPLLGLRFLLFLAGILGILGLSLSVIRKKRRFYLIGLPLLVFIISIFIPWSQKLLIGFRVAYFNLKNFPQLTLTEGVEQISALFVRDGVSATLGVLKNRGEKFLIENGKIILKSEKAPYFSFLGYLPLFLSDSPQKKTLLIGARWGGTLRAVESYTKGRIDCVEIEPLYLSASAYFEDKLNQKRKFYSYPPFYFLRESKERYEVIIVDIYPTLDKRNNYFLSRIFLKLIKRHLTEEGIILYRILLSNHTLAEQNRLIKDFSSVFPLVSFWSSFLFQDLILVGKEKESKLEWQEIDRLWKREMVPPECLSLGLSSPASLLAHLLLLDEVPFKISQTFHPDSLEKEKRIEYLIHRGEITASWMRATDYFDEAIRETPNFYKPYFKRAKYYLRLEEKDYFWFLKGRAERDLRKTLSLNPFNAEAHFLLGNILSKEGENEDAYLELSKAVKIEPGNKDYHLSMLPLEISAGRIEDAFKRAEFIKFIAGEDAVVLDWFGYLYFLKGDINLALDYFKRAEKIDRECERPIYHLGELYFMRSSYLESERYFLKILQISPENLKARLFLGKIALQLGKKKKAKRIFERILRFEPNNQVAIEYLKEL